MEGVVALLMAYFGHVCKNLLQSYNCHLTFMASHISVASSHTYALHRNVPSLFDNASDIIGVVVET